MDLFYSSKICKPKKSVHTRTGFIYIYINPRNKLDKLINHKFHELYKSQNHEIKLVQQKSRKRHDKKNNLCVC